MNFACYGHKTNAIFLLLVVPPHRLYAFTAQTGDCTDISDAMYTVLSAFLFPGYPIAHCAF